MTKVEKIIARQIASSRWLMKMNYITNHNFAMYTTLTRASRQIVRIGLP